MSDGYFAGDHPDIGSIQARVELPIFDDFPVGPWAWTSIETLYKLGYIAGCSSNPLLYCPEADMTRAESAVFVERGTHGASHTPLHPVEAALTRGPLGGR